MKKLNVAKKDACMACKACEIACSEAFYKKFDEDLPASNLYRKTA